MKKLICILLFSSSISCLVAQSDSGEVIQNKSKINELNERLDKLIKTTSEIPKDSLELKIDWLIQEMKVVKSDISTLKTTVNTVSNENKQILDELKNNVIDAKDLIADKFYVVIGSRRDELKAQELTKKLAVDHSVQLVMNSKGTWHHVILKDAFTQEEAIQKVNALRMKSSFKDAWWTVSKRLQN